MKSNLVVGVLGLSLALVVALVQAADEADLVHSLPGLSVKTGFRHFSGYLNAGNGANLHYWFFESASNPSTDPVMLWLNGGPGCSSMLGALSELGPIRLNRNGSLSLNPHAWNQKANILFLESPVGVGFSYHENHTVSAQNDTSTALLNLEALRSFFKKYPHLEKNPFFVAGESYAGIYIPTLSVLLLEHKFPENFKGIAIGNAYMDTTALGNSVLHFYYNHGLIDSAQWHTLVSNCCGAGAFHNHTDLRSCDFVNNHAVHCTQARSLIGGIISRLAINRYNIYDECRHDPSHPTHHEATTTQKPHTSSASGPQTLSYHQVMDRLMFESLNLGEEFYESGPTGHSPPCLSQDYLAQFLNNPEVKKALNINAKSWDWGPCRSAIGYHRELTSMKSQLKTIVNSEKIRVMIYNGDIDSVCNFLADEWLLEELGYETRIAYHAWPSTAQVYGFTRFYDKQLTFVTVRGAGHMVPEDKPVEAYKMISDFLGVK